MELSEQRAKRKVPHPLRARLHPSPCFCAWLPLTAPSPFAPWQVDQEFMEVARQGLPTH